MKHAEIQSAIAAMQLPQSVHVPDRKHVVRKYRADYMNKGRPETLTAKVRWDDQCGNGHNSFSVTGSIYGPDRIEGETTIRHESGRTLWNFAGGCCHEEIAKRIPELAPFIKWHLFDPCGPMHYVANTVYHVSDKDSHGLSKGERKQLRNGRTGKPVWELVVRNANGEALANIGHNAWRDSAECPEDTFTVKWEPVWINGEGKARELNHARATAVWPDATDEDLTAPGLEARLLARLPALVAEFKAAVESLGFVF